MSYIPKTIQAQPGLLQALALQTTIIEGIHNEAQRQVLRQTLYLGGPQPGVPATLPTTYEPTPHSLAWEHNMRAFLHLLSVDMRSPNPYNDHSRFAHASVLNAGWLDVPSHWQMAPGRKRTDHNCLVGRFKRVFVACGGFNRRFPVLLDRQGRVLDGDVRLQALLQLQEEQEGHYKSPERFYFLQLDF